MRGLTTIAPRLSLLFLIALTMSAPRSAQAQTFTVLHTFSGADGANPFGSLTLDRGGNLYGTASAGGYTGNNCSPAGCGTVFRLAPRGEGWIFTRLYSFQGDPDGATPYAGVTVGPNGSLYGTTLLGGVGIGTVFNLQPPPHTSANTLEAWRETPVYTFACCNGDGNYPAYGSLIFDPAGNIYGTTYEGGLDCGNDSGLCGMVFKLTPSGGGAWTLTSYPFLGHGGGANPVSGVVRDASGNLYGTTTYDGNFNPVAYKLTAGGGFSTLRTFTPGDNPQGGVILDGSGGLFGTTWGNGIVSTVYQLSPMGEHWNYSLLYDFNGSDNVGPESGVVRDAGGNLYGTTCADGRFEAGSIFKLTPTQGGWTETDLYDFTNGSDGNCPVGGMALDANGNLYGTSAWGPGNGCGGSGCGVVWKLTP